MDLSSVEGRQKFYATKAWRDLRAYKLSIDPFCVKCKAEGKLVAAKAVDHIIDIADAEDRCLDITNLQSLCLSCHSYKTFKGRVTPSMKAKSTNILRRMWKI